MGMTFHDLTPEELCDLMCGEPEDEIDDLNERLENAGFDIENTDLKNAIRFDNMNECVIGVTYDDCLVYSYWKMVKYYEDRGYEHIEAMDTVDYGILRFYGQYGKQSPVVMYDI